MLNRMVSLAEFSHATLGTSVLHLRSAKVYSANLSNSITILLIQFINAFKIKALLDTRFFGFFTRQYFRRIQMAAQGQEDTVFHKIMRKELPATFVYEDDKCFAIKDLNPVAPVHYLIIPRKTLTNLAKAEEADEPVLGHLLYVASKLAKQEKLDEGYRVCINTNAHGCQTVYQLHVHLVGGRQLKSKRLYRRFMNLTRRIENKQERKDMRIWIRDDFKFNKNLTDEYDIKSQHVRARTAMEELENSIDLSNAKK